MRDVLAEVFAAMRHNKMRIVLTGFSIGWGIFLLIVMLGTGNGVLNGVLNGFSGSTNNIISMSPGKTFIAFDGLPKNREIQITETDCNNLQRDFNANIQKVVIELDTAINVYYEKESNKTTIAGYYPGYSVIKNNRLVAGRDINSLDIDGRRKVCVVSRILCDRLFHNGEPPVGKTIVIYDVAFLIVGVYEPNKSSDNSRVVFAPYTTVKDLYFRDDKVSLVSLVVSGLTTPEANEQFVVKLRNWFAMEKNFSSRDERAVSISNSYEFYLQISGVLDSIQFFIWIVGFATLVAGVVGISNIMLISVKERLRELGVRKAMGASSFSIIRLVLLESVFITLLFGYIGMLIGISLTQLADFVSSAVLGENNSTFVHPTVSLSIVLSANFIMVITGLIAGYVPAKKAVSIKLVDALAGNG